MQRDNGHIVYHRTIEREKYINASPPNSKLGGGVDKYLRGLQSICNQGALETEKMCLATQIRAPQPDFWVSAVFLRVSLDQGAGTGGRKVL